MRPNELGLAVGLPLLAFLLYDSNAYYFHYPLPSFAFWDFTLPLALLFYAFVGLAFVTGYLKVEQEDA